MKVTWLPTMHIYRDFPPRKQILCLMGFHPRMWHKFLTGPASRCPELNHHHHHHHHHHLLCLFLSFVNKIRQQLDHATFTKWDLEHNYMGMAKTVRETTKRANWRETHMKHKTSETCKSIRFSVPNNTPKMLQHEWITKKNCTNMTTFCLCTEDCWKFAFLSATASWDLLYPGDLSYMVVGPSTVRLEKELKKDI